MKPVITLRIGSETVAVASQHLILELAGCGRGFITVLTTADTTGQLVRLDLGYDTTVYRWFTGFVERSSPAENGAQRIFVRELVGIFDGQWPVSLQHPTLRDVADAIAKSTDMVFSLPENVGYTDTPIPHFTHSGAQIDRQPAPWLGFWRQGGFAMCARFCNVLQKCSGCAWLTDWIT